MSGQLLICAAAVVLLASLGAATIPPSCPPGSHLSSGSGNKGESCQSCQSCQSCPTGSYMDEFNRYKGCKRHRECGKDEDVLVSGTNVSDVVCRCRSGGRRYHNLDDETSGYDCWPCTGGDISMNVINGMDRGDTECCPPDSQAFRTRDGLVQCLGLGERGGNSPVSSPSTPATTFPPLPSANEDPRQWKTYFIVTVTPLVLALVVISIVFLIFTLKNRRGKRRMSLSEDEDEFSLDSNT